MLDEALNDNTVEVEMFAYDLNDPGIAQRCLNLAAPGRIRMILDNATLHRTQTGKPTTEEDDFQARFKAVAGTGAELFRCPFARYSHCKVLDELTVFIQTP